MSVLIVTHDAMDAHVSPGHPERPERRHAAIAGARDGAERRGAAIVEREAERVADRWLVAVHDVDYIAALDDGARRGGGWIDADTYVAAGSPLAARLAAGATASAALAALDGSAEVALALVRPPGHHARREMGSGFCLFNNVAVAVAALRERGVRRVTILDWDVHHGDGTHDLFEADPDVAYASTHQSPFYPGTGDATDRGVGDGVGTMHNRPLPAGAGDAEFVAAWRDELLPALEAFAPEAVLVSAGYDAHRDDPLALLEVTDAGYELVAREAGAMSARLGLGGVALTLEGGYDLDALRHSVAATVAGILDGRRLVRDAATPGAILEAG